MADNENLEIAIKTRGGREAAAQVKGLQKAYEDLGYTVKKVSHTFVDDSRARARQSAKEQSAVQRQQLAQQKAQARAIEQQRAATLGFVKGATAAATLAAAYGSLKAATAGFSFNAEQELSRVSFEFFLKSADAAKKQMRDLIKLGNQMPGVGQGAFTTSAKQLLAFGMNAKQVTPLLASVGAAVNASGKGPEGLQAATRSLGQILATGKVQGDELNELANWGVYARRYLYESGLAKQGTDIGTQNIPAESAIAAIQAGLQKDYAGLTPKLNNTWTNQTAAAKQYATQAAAALVKPFQDWLQSNVLPQLGEQLKRLTGWLKAGGADRLWKTLKITAMVLAPLVALWGVHATVIALNAARIVLLNFAINAARGVLLLFRGAILVATAAQWLWNAAMSANPIGLVIIGIAALIGIIVLVVKHWDKVKAAFVAVWDWISDHPWIAIFAGPLGAMVVLATQVVKHWDKIKAVILKVWDAISPIIGKMIDFLKFAVKWSPAGMIGKGLGIDIPFMAGGGTIPVGGAAITGERGPELIRNRGGGAEVIPLGGGSAGQLTALHVHTMIDSREIAESVFNVGFTAAARA